MSGIRHPLKEIITRFYCQRCDYRFKKLYKWKLSRSICPKCGKEIIIPFKEKETKTINPIIHRTPLTEWQKKKLGFYKSEKKWHEDIVSRMVLPNGDVAIVDHKGEIKEVRSKR